MKFLQNILQKPLFWCLVLTLSLGILIHTFWQLRKENQRISWNQSQMNQELKSIQLINGKIAKESSVLLLRMNELQQGFPQISKEIKAMDIAKRKVVQFAQTATQNSLQFEAKISDSFGMKIQTIATTNIDSNPYKIFNYQDNYYTVNGRSYLDKQWVNINSRDTLIQIVYRQRKNRWLWVLSPFVYKQRISCANPNASIYYSQIIQIQK